MIQLSHPFMTIGKTIVLTIRNFVGKVISLLCNTLSRFVIAFLPMSKCLNSMAAVAVCSNFRDQENKIPFFNSSILHLLLRVPWTVRRSNHSILKEISPEYSLEGLMLKLQHFGHLIQRNNSLEKTLMLGKIEGRRRRG